MEQNWMWNSLENEIYLKSLKIDHPLVISSSLIAK